MSRHAAIRSALALLALHALAGLAAAQSIDIVQARRTVMTNRITISGRIPLDNTVPQSNEGAEVMTVQITPTSASNLLMVEALVYASEATNTEDNIVAALFRDSDTSAIAAGVASASPSTEGGITSVSVTHFVSAGSTSPTTFRLRVGGDFVGGAVRINAQGFTNLGLGGGVLRSYLQVVELFPQ